MLDYLDSDVRGPATRDALVSELGVKPARLRRNIKAQQPFFMNGAFQFQIAQVLLDRGSKKADLQLWRDFCRSALWYSYEEVKAVGCVMLQRLIDGEKAEKIQREVSCCFTVKKSRFLAYNPKIKNKARKSQSVGYNSNNSNNYNNYNNNNPRSRDFAVVSILNHRVLIHHANLIMSVPNVVGIMVIKIVHLIKVIKSVVILINLI